MPGSCRCHRGRPAAPTRRRRHRESQPHPQPLCDSGQDPGERTRADRPRGRAGQPRRHGLRGRSRRARGGRCRAGRGDALCRVAGACPGRTSGPGGGPVGRRGPRPGEPGKPGERTYGGYGRRCRGGNREPSRQCGRGAVGPPDRVLHRGMGVGLRSDLAGALAYSIR